MRVSLDGGKRNEQVPALVLGSGINGLGVARSLGAVGVPVYLADTDVSRPELHTRYARALQLEALHGPGLIRELTELAASRFPGRRPVLVLTQEQTVRAVATQQDALRPFYRFVLPPGDVLESLMHKEGFDRLATETGLRVPRTVHVRTGADIETALRLDYPLIVKPALHDPDYQRTFRKAYRLGGADEARVLLERILPVLPDVVVQEWIPGSDSEVCFCLQSLSADGRPLASFVGRKIRSWPPNVGGTASCTAASEWAEAAEITADFFGRVGMRGLASMEYKRHAVTGELVAIEPTVGRTDYQEEVASLNGVNLPYAYYRSALDAETPPVAVAPVRNLPVVWRDRQADRQSLARPEQTVRGWPQAHGPVRDALWRIDDPGPWLAALRQRAARKARSLLRGRTPERERT